MSFRVGTPNYGLPQTEGTDKRDWSDTNQPFLVIDTAIKNAVDTSASASSAAATAQQTADGATTAASHAQTDATTAQTLATSASELATTAKNRADSAYGKAEANEAAIAELSKNSFSRMFGPTDIQSTGTISYTAPADGYLVIAAFGSSTSTNLVSVGYMLSGSIARLATATNAGTKWGFNSIYLRKGTTVAIQADTANAGLYIFEGLV